MELGLVGEFIQYGIFAGLFIALFIYTIRSGEKRESALRETLNKFADTVGDKLEDISKDLDEVKSDVEDIKVKIH